MKFKKVAIVACVAILSCALVLISIRVFAKPSANLKPEVQALVPPVVNYQGLLTDASGESLTGSYSMTFKLYASLLGGTPLWQESQAVTVTKGLFNVYLGSQNPLSEAIFIGQDLYLGVTVGLDQEMQPRTRLASAPYAFTAGQSICQFTNWFLDQDGDGFGNPNLGYQACSAPPGYVSNNTDCNDSNPFINPIQIEVCNGLDDNCDGIVDNGNPGGGLACSTGLLGVCAPGTTTCSGGAITCVQNVSPSSETCDGLDNNCNGQIDEGNPGGGQACSTGLLGVCAAGTTTCSAGAIICNENVSPSTEICDGLDNNCNGVIDEGCP